MQRRDVVAMMGMWSAALALRPLSSLVVRRAARVRLIVVAAHDRAATADRDLGITLGVEEAAHAARLFGGAIESRTIEREAPAALSRAVAAAFPGAPITAIVGGDDVATCIALGEMAASHDCLHVNVSCSSDALRGADCRRRTFHICPSDAMLRDALGEPPPADGRQAVAWSATLERYGADTLNRRFRARFDRPMTSGAWCGWMAVKTLWETSLRAHSTGGRALMSFLESESASFDGHKGRPLSFRAWDHQLRQPLYVTSGSAGQRSTVEVPASTNPDEASRDVLDRIGHRAAESGCHWAGT